MKKLELMSPARTADTGIAAVDCGADGVYIGATRFGAREKAGNRVRDIARLCEYAHRFSARVYVTLNTLLTDSELKAARALVREVYDAGADGLIVQDMGLMEMDLPSIPLIASTQTHNCTPEKVRFLEQAGFSRVILARELSLKEIRSIRAVTTVELESFVYGALCVSYSGRCYASFAAGGRSGNRGQCAQPCRKEYTLRDGPGKPVAIPGRHLLSLKDLDLSAHLADLADAGITSFKIEGRLKDDAYVRNITAYFRRELDRMADGRFGRSSAGQSIIPFVPDPAKTFNRGRSSYNLQGRPDRIGALRTPKSVGEPVGTVTDSGPGYLAVDKPHDLAAGDGVCWFNPDGILTGAQVTGRDDQGVRFEGDVPPPVRAAVYRNHHHAFIKQVMQPCRRFIDVKAVLEEKDDCLVLTFRDQDGCTGTASLPVPGEEARDAGAAADTLRRQAAKTGTTIYRCRQVILQWKHLYFIRTADINQLRREALAALDRVRAAAYRRPRPAQRNPKAPYPYTGLTPYDNVTNRLAEQFYRYHGVTKIPAGVEVGGVTPETAVMTTKYCLRRELGRCTGRSWAMPEPWSIEDGDGNVLKLVFECGRCGMKVFRG